MKTPEQYRKLPILGYSGLTVVMSNPSRFDTNYLLSGYAGSYFKESLYPISINSCDLRLAQDNSSFLPNTKVVLCLGEFAAKKYIDQNLSLNEVRGCPYFKDDIIYIATYSPQDAMDMKASYEKTLNKNKIFFKDPAPAEEDDEDSDLSDTGQKSTHANTARANYKFWLKKDVAKAIRLLRDEVREEVIKQQSFSNFKIYPSLVEVIDLLTSTKDSTIVVDIETSECLDLWCVGLSVGDIDNPVYVIPVYLYNGQKAYGELPRFLWALSRALQSNLVIAHNAMFDLFVLSAGYGVGFGKRIFDTMLAAHRLEPDIEKSLGHCISLYTYRQYHKNEGNFFPRNNAQQEALWRYNGNDVYTTKLLFKALSSIDNPSISQVNSSVYPYLLMSLTGIRYDQKKLEEIISLNDRYMTQYLRILRILTGLPQFKPNSSKSCADYYHNHLGLPVVKRSGKTGAPSLDEKSMLELAIRHKHPTIPLVLEFRRLQKQTSSLTFRPWRDKDDIKVSSYNIRKELAYEE